MNYCKKCLFPETKPDLYFDDNGICDSCHSADRKHGILNAIDWDQKAKQFEELVENAKQIKKGSYDCIVPVSGGKDSTYQVLQAKNKHGMKVLAVTFDQFDQTDIGKYDIKILQEIGVDHVHFTLSPIVVKSLVKKGFELVGDPYWVNHVGMFTVPYIMAVNFQVPLVIFGENPQLEYGGPEASKDSFIMDKRWRQEFGGMRGLRESDMIDTEISEADLSALKFPSDEQMTDARVTGVFYGSFYKWDIGNQLPLVEKVGWKRLPEPPKGSWVDYENCDMRYIDIRERIKFLKFGYGRATDQINIEIRNGRISREQGLIVAKEIDGEVSRKNEDDFCNFIGISREEYLTNIDSFVNRNIFNITRKGEYKLKENRV
tara:strand:- start:1682 stop:2803 length:1122 start_codon:yes stop_codon:yes gene_type:complete